MQRDGAEMIQFFERNWQNLLLSAVVLGAAVAISLIAHYIVFWLLQRFARRKAGVLDQSLIRHGQGPTRWIFPLLTALAVLPGVPLPPILMSDLNILRGGFDCCRCVAGDSSH
jgi:hypothetical protein